MRTFIITAPGLSAGRRGDHVTLDDLGMDDETVDGWLEAGFGVELHDETGSHLASTVTTEVVEDAEPVGTDIGPEFEPGADGPGTTIGGDGPRPPAVDVTPVPESSLKRPLPPVRHR